MLHEERERKRKKEEKKEKKRKLEELHCVENSKTQHYLSQFVKR
jgi:hypothetical protein